MQAFFAQRHASRSVDSNGTGCPAGIAFGNIRLLVHQTACGTALGLGLRPYGGLRDSKVA